MTGLQAGITTDAEFGDAEIVAVEPEPVRRVLALGVIPVVTGFQGGTAEYATTTLGRGGSDLTAVALGDALGAAAVEIYTTCPGVMTGDPRRIRRDAPARAHHPSRDGPSCPETAPRSCTTKPPSWRARRARRTW